MVSGSRVADRDVNPTRSANRTVTTRRSVAGPPGSVAPLPSVVAGAAALPAPRFVPQLPQNLAPGGLVAPHVGQPPSAVPHSMQKRPSEGFGVPHFGQVTMQGEYPSGSCQGTRSAAHVESGLCGRPAAD